jgi:hypothetical protein
LTPEQRQRLESLLAVPDGERRSTLDRLRDGPALQSPAELSRAVDRLKEVQELRFIPAFLRTVSFVGTSAGKPILEAIEYVCAVVDDGRRSGPAPTAFVPAAWARQVRDERGAIDMTGYRLCLLDQMRVSIRRRDIYVGPELDTRSGNPESRHIPCCSGSASIRSYHS